MKLLAKLKTLLKKLGNRILNFLAKSAFRGIVENIADMLNLKASISFA